MVVTVTVAMGADVVLLGSEEGVVSEEVEVMLVVLVGTVMVGVEEGSGDETVLEEEEEDMVEVAEVEDEMVEVAEEDVENEEEVENDEEVENEEEEVENEEEVESENEDEEEVDVGAAGKWKHRSAEPRSNVYSPWSCQ